MPLDRLDDTDRLIERRRLCSRLVLQRGVVRTRTLEALVIGADPTRDTLVGG